VADWYGRTISAFSLGIPPGRFTSQAFWDALEKILPDRLDRLATGEDAPVWSKYSCGATVVSE
jgi:S-adenosylmethionine:diacylglycerol 3-amino-3-carboxypropyl transferase